MHVGSAAGCDRVSSFVLPKKLCTETSAIRSMISCPCKLDVMPWSRVLRATFCPHGRPFFFFLVGGVVSESAGDGGHRS